MNGRIAKRLLIYGTILIALMAWLWLPRPTPADRVVIEVDVAGVLRLDGENAAEDFPQRLQTVLDAKSGKPVELWVHPAAPNAVLVPVMESLRAAGVSDYKIKTVH